MLPSFSSQHRVEDLTFRDPDHFLAGQLHNHIAAWDHMLSMLGTEMGCDQSYADVRSWLNEGVDVTAFLQPYKGKFQGKSYNAAIPPSFYARNPPQGKNHAHFIARTLEERLRNGSLELLGRVGEVPPPLLVMPLVVEESKPRLCHDERFLNLFCKDSPFKLETLKDVPPLLNKGTLMASCDEKSAYDNVLLHKDSQKFFGLQFGGWYLVYRTLPFGWKCSPYVYQTIGLLPTSFLRNMGIPTTLYLDDHFVAEWQPTRTWTDGMPPQPECSRYAVYCMCLLLFRLGYTVSLKKSTLLGCVKLRHLGLYIDSVQQAFSVPEDKIISFLRLRETLLQASLVGVKTLQRFQGKCVSFMLCVPGALLFTHAMANAVALSQVANRRGLVRIEGALLEEITHWGFLDGFSGWIPWRSQRHHTVTISTDASGFRWGATMQGEEYGDYWALDDDRPIHLKEGDAVIHALTTLENELRNSHVDVLVDNQAVIAAWSHEGCRDVALTGLMKDLFFLTCRLNIKLRMTYVPSASNTADAPSRALSSSDARLHEDVWSLVDSLFGPYTVDMMALDSNAVCNADGICLPHFTPCALPHSSGVNVFSQTLSSRENYYVFPPFNMVQPILSFLKEHVGEGIRCSMVVPRFVPISSWWPMLYACRSKHKLLVKKGSDAVYLPTRSGWRLKSLPCDLYVMRLYF